MVGDYRGKHRIPKERAVKLTMMSIRQELLRTSIMEHKERSHAIMQQPGDSVA
jgi:hypothetical protein